MLRPSHRFCPSCGAPVRTGPSLQVQAAQNVDLSENRRLVTVLFADLSGSTALGERVDIEDLRRILSSFFSTLSREIQRYGGTVDKYIGDAVMAVFGAPVAHEDDAERAVNAALAMQAAIAGLNNNLERRLGQRLHLRIGINTGEVVAGLLAGDVQGAYTVVGDTVNTAQRIESSAPLGGVLVSDSTWRLVQRSFEFEPPIELTLKGKSEPQIAYRAVGRRDREMEVSETTLIGREAELAQLRKLLDGASGGQGSLVHVVGEAGVGKSRLLRELRAGLGVSVATFVARCASFEVDTPYAVLARLIRSIFAVTAGADESTARDDLGRGFADVGDDPDPIEVLLLLDVLGYRQRSPLDPQSKQRMLVALLKRLLERWADRATLLVILEDLHWIDAASSATLTELARDVVARPCLVVSTSRTGWNPRWPCSTLALEALGDESARHLVESVAGTRLEEDLMQVILARTGGNPFFVEEVVRGLWDSGVLVERDGRVVVQPGATPRVPATIQEVLLSRLDRLPDSARSVVRPAAVCGRTFWQRVVGYVVKDRPVNEGLATLEHEQFVIRRPVPIEPSYAFRHALIQEVAYQTQLQSQRRITHGAIGEAIEALFADRLDEFVNELAFHFGRSDNDPKALRWLVRAGDRARALYANQEALALYAGALERARDGEGPLDAGAILERVGDVQALIGRNDEAIASFESALARILDPRPATAARLKRKVGTALRIKGVYEQAEGTLAAARSTLDSRLDIEHAQIALQIGQLHWRTGEYAQAREALSDAVEIASALDQDEVLAEGLKQLGNIPLHAGDPREAVDLFKRSQAIYQQLEDIAGIAMARLNLGTAYGRLGRWDESLAELTSSLAQFERIGDQWHIAVVHNNLGELYRQRGDFSKAISAFERAAAISQEIGYASGVANALTGVGSARVESGFVEQGRADLLAAASQFTALGRSMYMPHIRRFLASAELALGNLEAAAAEAARSVEFARAANATHEEAMTQRVQAQIALARGDRSEALVLLHASRQTLADVGEAGELARTEALLRDLEAR